MLRAGLETALLAFPMTARLWCLRLQVCGLPGWPFLGVGFLRRPRTSKGKLALGPRLLAVASLDSFAVASLSILHIRTKPGAESVTEDKHPSLSRLSFPHLWEEGLNSSSPRPPLAIQ